MQQLSKASNAGTESMAVPSQL
uniref:Uncharacterized protein n=1 Tax=Rhizophora mucronata TaxID=61149 RepID=A0A2P2NE82_RHIMU